MRGVIFSYHEQSARILIYAVHNTGANYATDTRQTVTAMIKQSVYKRSVGISRGRVYDHSLGFIDNDNIGVLIYDIKRNILRQCL